jgi:hypothetical protein
MIGFLIRKTFYDLWDNMFRIVLLNLGFIAVVSIPIFIPSLAGSYFNSIALEMVLTAWGILICFIYLAAAALCVSSISDYSSFGFSDFIKNLKIAWRPGLVMGFFVFVLFLIVSIIMPFYLGVESPVGLVFAAVIFWVTVFSLLSFQFYFTVYCRLGKKVFKSLKKCMLISLDNVRFSIFMIIHNLIVMIISIVFVFMFPGPAGVLLYLDEALRLRILKYDWLEENPGENRKKIPWDTLLIEERERTGTRTFKNFIFPWKD